jgi:hypothetical protein
VDATSRKYREATFDGADGVVLVQQIIGGGPAPPRLRLLLRMLRDFLLLAQPPLLG